MKRKNQPINFVQGLQLVFIAAKLFGAIDWGWGYVLIPTWIDIAVIALSCVKIDVDND